MIQCTAYVLPLGGHLLGYYIVFTHAQRIGTSGGDIFVVGGCVPLGDEVGELEDVLTNFLCVVICTGCLYFWTERLLRRLTLGFNGKSGLGVVHALAQPSAAKLPWMSL